MDISKDQDASCGDLYEIASSLKFQEMTDGPHKDLAMKYCRMCKGHSEMQIEGMTSFCDELLMYAPEPLGSRDLPLKWRVETLIGRTSEELSNELSDAWLPYAKKLGERLSDSTVANILSKMSRRKRYKMPSLRRKSWGERIAAWCRIENVVCENSRSGFPLKRTPCDELASTECETLPNCVPYRKRCVDERHLQYFDAKEVSSLFTAGDGTKFRILEGPIPFQYSGTIFHDAAKEIRPYSHIIDVNKRILVAFNCGVVLNMKRVVAEEEPWYKQILDSLLALQPEKDALEVVIVGHSMGASLALRFAMFVRHLEKDFFRMNCSVACSAPFPCVTPREMRTFSNSVNKIRVFATAKEEVKEFNGRLVLRRIADPFITNKSNSKDGFYPYLPFQFFLFGKDSIEEEFVNSLQHPLLKTFIKHDATNYELHLWSTYLIAFLAVYSVDTSSRI